MIYVGQTSPKSLVAAMVEAILAKPKLCKPELWALFNDATFQHEMGGMVWDVWKSLTEIQKKEVESLVVQSVRRSTAKSYTWI